MKKAAGILFVTPKGTALFLKRGKEAKHFPLHWDLPGGHVEGDETAEQAALREAEEEVGKFPKGTLVPHTRTKTMAVDGSAVGIGVPPAAPATNVPQPIAESPPMVPPPAPAAVDDDQVDFTTFIMKVDEEFVPEINDEHIGYSWAPVSSPPEVLHPGVRITLERITMDELGVARAIASGRLISPQRYENVWLYAIRITGTDVAYRNTLDEFVLRKPELYLNDEFLARCNGLPVIYRQRSGKDGGYHPRGSLLTSKEFEERIVGTIFLPYIAQQEVWGVAKIFDDECAADMEAKQLSTSPAVYFRDVSVNSKMGLDNGSTLLIEGKPSLLDHVCICEQGVWDKGGDATGVRSEARGDSAMADEKVEEKKADADAGHELDKTLSHIADAMGKMADHVGDLHRRMDAIEEESKTDRARRDAEEKEEKKADARRRKDDDEEDEHRDDDEDDEPKRLAADGKKKDSHKKDAAKKDEDEDKDEEKKDSAKKDEDEDEKKGDAKGDAKADALDPAIQKAINEVAARIPRTLGDADYYAITDAQARADDIYTLFGLRAPRPLDGDTLATYERRCVKDLLKHSDTWGKIDPNASAAFADDTSFAVIREQVYADAIRIGKDPGRLPAAGLRPQRRRSPSGHEIIEYYGDPSSWMDPISGPVRRYVKSGLEHKPV